MEAELCNRMNGRDLKTCSNKHSLTWHESLLVCVCTHACMCVSACVYPLRGGSPLSLTTVSLGTAAETNVIALLLVAVNSVVSTDGKQDGEGGSFVERMNIAAFDPDSERHRCQTA